MVQGQEVFSSVGSGHADMLPPRPSSRVRGNLSSRMETSCASFAGRHPVSTCTQMEKFPMAVTVRRMSTLAACLLAGLITVCWRPETRAAGPKDPKPTATRLDQPETQTAGSWDQKAAAAYLDQRASWWMEWPKS